MVLTDCQIASFGSRNGYFGIKARSTAGNAVVLDLVVARGSPASIGLAYQFALLDDVDLSPGLAVSIGGNPQLTTGFNLQQDF